MSGMHLPLDIIRNIFSYGDVNDIPKRKMVFDQLLFLKKQFTYHKYEHSARIHRERYTYLPYYGYVLQKNRSKMYITIPNDKLNFNECKSAIEYFPFFLL